MTPQNYDEYTILHIDQGNLEITMSDGSVWSVFVGDAPTIDTWYSSQRIRIDPHADMDHPYRLVNLDVRGESFALARSIA